jgi:two-component system phosphate regulon response regulator PhoB
MRKILVAEDEQDLRDMLLIFLATRGYDPIVCQDGAAAWDHLQKEGAGLAVLDINMPRMSGLELCQRIRRNHRLKDLPIIMLSVKRDIQDRVKGFETGADDYIGKPFDFPDLLARIRALECRALG